MDPLLALIITLLAFALIIFIVGRSVRWVVLVGCATAVLLAVRFLGLA